MPTTEVANPKRTTKTVTTIIQDGDDAQESPLYRGEFWEVVERIDWPAGEHKARVYRATETWQRDSSPEDNVITDKFDEDYIRAKFGGGRYIIWLYGPPHGSKVVKHPFRLKLEGTPKFSSNGNGNGAGESDSALKMVLSELLQELRASRGGNVAQDALKGALDLQAAALKSGVETVRQLNPVATAPATLAEKSALEKAMEKFMEVMIMRMMNPEPDPFQKALQEATLKKLLDPADPIDKFRAIATAMKEFSPGGGKTDFGAVIGNFVQTLPAIIDKGFNGVREYRLGNEAAERAFKLQKEHDLGRSDVIDVPAGAETTASAPAAEPAAQAAPQVTVVQDVTIELVQLKIVQAIQNLPEISGEDLYDCIYWLAPELNAQLGAQTPESLLVIFHNQPILAKVADDPRLPKIIEQYLTYVKEIAKTKPA